LKVEQREKTKELELPNLEVHSYHAMGVKYYSPDAFRDTGLRLVIEKDKPPKRMLPFYYDIIIIDEAQDMTALLYSFACKIVRDIFELSHRYPLFLIIGDENQNIFKFLGADYRY
jgi:hypothetical protein